MNTPKWLAILSMGTAAACLGAPDSESVSGSIRKISEIHPYMENGRNGRLEYLARARVATTAPSSLTPREILQGQPYGGFAMDERVSCHFLRSGSEMNGMTPKFECEHEGKKYKVKFLPNILDNFSNMEMYSEVATTRLLWLAGFGADADYPVMVDCEDCPADPREPMDPETNPPVGYHGPGVIERKMPGAEIKADDVDGWSWREFDAVAGYTGSSGVDGRPEVEALRLFAAMVQHADCKPPQQRMICPPQEIVAPESSADEDEVDDTADTAHCRQPVAYMQDVGVTLGEGAGPYILGVGLRITNHQFDLDAWRDRPFLEQNDEGVCQTSLSTNITCDGLGPEAISESGRRFLVERLTAMITDASGQRNLDRVKAVFQAAHVERLGYTADDWAAVFAAKVDFLAGLTCTERPLILNAQIPESVEPGAELSISATVYDPDGLVTIRPDSKSHRRETQVRANLRQAGTDNELWFNLSVSPETTRANGTFLFQVPEDAFGPYELVLTARDGTGTEGNHLTLPIDVRY